MTILSQLVEFIFLRRQVKDIEYAPNICTLFIVGDALPLFFLVTLINSSGLELDGATINHISLGVPIVYSLIFTALFYSFFAAKQLQTRFVQAATAFFGASLILSLVNVLLAQIPGLGIIGLVVIVLKILCTIRVATESLGYSIPRALFSFIGIGMMAALIALTLFPLDITETTPADQLNQAQSHDGPEH